MLTNEDLKAIGRIVEEKNDEVLEAVNKGFQGVQDQLNGMQGQINGMQGQINGMQGQINGIDSRLQFVESNMVTKDFLERRLGKTDGKINALVGVLERKRVISEDEKRTIHLS
jgi:archaellum component FlaC